MWPIAGWLTAASSQSPWSNPNDLRLFSSLSVFTAPLFLYYSSGGGGGRSGVTLLPFRFTLCRVCLLSHTYCLWVSGTEIPEQGTVPSNDFLRGFLCRQPTVPPSVPQQHQARSTHTPQHPSRKRAIVIPTYAHTFFCSVAGGLYGNQSGSTFKRYFTNITGFIQLWQTLKSWWRTRKRSCSSEILHPFTLFRHGYFLDQYFLWLISREVDMFFIFFKSKVL